MHPARTPLRGCFLVAVTGVSLLRAQAPLDDNAVALRTWEAMRALDRYLETWNSRDPALWAASLHYPHVRPGAGQFEVSRTPAEYAAGVNFEQTRRTGWDHTEWVSREALQVGPSKVHIAGNWQRFTAEGRPQTSSAITYVLTEVAGHWGVLARFAAGTGTIDAAAETRNASAGRAAVTEFFRAWNSHDSEQVASAIHYPQVRIADERVDMWRTKAEFLAGAEPGRQRTWYQTHIDNIKVVQTTSNGVNLTVKLSRLGRDGNVLSADEGVFLVVLRDGAWKVQARSLMGS